MVTINRLYKGVKAVLTGCILYQITFSLVSSLVVFLGILAGTSASSRTSLVLPPLNTIAIGAAFLHNRIYWKVKAKIPFVGGYNEGIEKSKEIRQSLLNLGLGWGIWGMIQWMRMVNQNDH